MRQMSLNGKSKSVLIVQCAYICICCFQRDTALSCSTRHDASNGTHPELLLCIDNMSADIFAQRARLVLANADITKVREARMTDQLLVTNATDAQVRYTSSVPMY